MKFVRYDSNGTILSYGVIQAPEYKKQLAAGRRIVAVSELKLGMEVTHKVKNPGKPTGELEATGISKTPPVVVISNKKDVDVINSELADIKARLTVLEKK